MIYYRGSVFSTAGSPKIPRKKGTAGRPLLFCWKSRETALLPAVPPAVPIPGTLPSCPSTLPGTFRVWVMTYLIRQLVWELRKIYHHHPESKKIISSEEKSGFIHPYGRYGNAVKTRKTISTIAILWPVKAIFEKRAATVEVDSFLSPACGKSPKHQSG